MQTGIAYEIPCKLNFDPCGVRNRDRVLQRQVEIKVAYKPEFEFGQRQPGIRFQFSSGVS